MALQVHLQLPRFHLVGIAGGGFVALDYAAWHPENIRALVVAASNGQFQEPEMAAFAERIDIPGITDPKLRIYREVGVAYRAADPEGLARFAAMAHAARQPDAPAQPMRTPNTFAKVAQITLPTLGTAPAQRELRQRAGRRALRQLGAARSLQCASAALPAESALSASMPHLPQRRTLWATRATPPFC